MDLQILLLVVTQITGEYALNVNGESGCASKVFIEWSIFTCEKLFSYLEFMIYAFANFNILVQGNHEFETKLG